MISDEQCEAGLAHPRRDEAAALRDLARQLIWMVQERIVAHAKLISLWERSTSVLGDGNQGERNQVLSQVLPRLEAMSPNLNEKLLDSLLAQGLLMKSEHESTMAQPCPIVFQSEGQALAHVVDCGAMPLERFNTLAAQVQTEKTSVGGEPRMAIIEEASGIVLALILADEALASASAQAKKRNWLVSLLGAGVVLFAAYQAYQWIDAVPACDSSSVTEPILEMMSSTAGRIDPNHVLGSPKLSQIREVGHASARHQRGCTANVELDGESLPYAYVIAPLSDKNETIAITGAHRAIVEARFANITKNGDFANKAEPIGRDALEAAMRAALEHNGPALHGLLNPIDPVKALFSNVSFERIREITEIEPVGACRELQRGIRYACKVMVERNDPILQMIGKTSEIVEGEFTFERAGEGKEWRMSEDFASAFASALHEARMKAVRGGKTEPSSSVTGP